MLIESGDFTPWEFVGSFTDTLASDIPLADTSLDQTEQLNPAEMRTTVQKATDALPANVIAHRLGDYVFTYHGIDSSNADGGLWIVVFSADPDSDVSGWGSEYLCGALDGSVTPVYSMGMPTALTAQNTLRANHGLPPLPDPATVTHGQPAALRAPPAPEPPTPEVPGE